MLDTLFIKSQDFVRLNNLPYKRYFIHTHTFQSQISIILGARGIGKSTTLAQYMATHYKDDEALYVNLDDISLESSIIDIAHNLYNMGGKILCLDEIHKYENWAIELKNIYDFYPSLKVIATGSGAIQIHKQSHDLSRRAIVYYMCGMSFREFLELKMGLNFMSINLEILLNNHTELAKDIATQAKPILKHFKDYLTFGYYPYHTQMPLNLFKITLNQQINTTIENDLLSINPKLSGVSIRKIKQLLGAIIQNAPFSPNISKIKESVKISDDRTLKEYFDKASLRLIDFKLEFGRDSNKNILLADEISPDSCRLWDKATNKKMDKDIFRQNLGNVTSAYREVLSRLTEIK